jgi:hypothetical protein
VFDRSNLLKEERRARRSFSGGWLKVPMRRIEGVARKIGIVESVFAGVIVWTVVVFAA